VFAKDAVSGVNVIDVAADDVSANDADCGVNVIDVAADAVFAKDAVSGVNVIDVAADAVFANDADVILPLKLPVLICNELETVPVGKNVVTCAELLTMFAGILESPVYDTCPELDTTPDGSTVGAKEADTA
jgi:hypothetical protein